MTEQETTNCVAKLKIEAGRRYVRLDGQISGIITQRPGNSVYPFVDMSQGTTYTSEGKFFCTDGRGVSKHDLVAEFVPESKQILNFWEARQVALAGKKVKRTDCDDVYTVKDFENYTSWHNTDIAAEWEIVEEPEHTTHRFMINSKTTIAITVDEDGKLIKAENV
jgi:hypothetical protein